MQAWIQFLVLSHLFVSFDSFCLAVVLSFLSFPIRIVHLLLLVLLVEAALMYSFYYYMKILIIEPRLASVLESLCPLNLLSKRA